MRLKLPKPDQVKGLCLDLDGTLANSLPSLQATYYGFLVEFGRKGSQSEFDSLNGVPLAKAISTLKRTHDLPGTEQELLKNYLKRVEAQHAESSPNPGALELIRYALDRSIRLAIVTSATQAQARNWAKRWEILEHFHAVVGCDSVARGKPDPAPYSKALSLLKVSADQAIALEDSVLGAQSATQAGIATLFFSPMQLKGPDFAAAVISQLSEVQKYVQ